MYRSDRFYFYFIILICSLVALVSLVGVYRAMTGRSAERPAYEDAPPAAAYAPPERSIVDQTLARRTPIEDEDFAALHRGTRELAPKLVTAGWKAALAEIALRPDELAASGELSVQEARGAIAGLERGPARAVDVGAPVRQRLADPEAPGGTVTQVTVKTSTTMVFAAADAEADQGITAIFVDLFWRQRALGRWDLTGMTLRTRAPSGSGSTTLDDVRESAGGEESGQTTTPDEPSSEVPQDGSYSDSLTGP